MVSVGINDSFEIIDEKAELEKSPEVAVILNRTALNVRKRLSRSVSKLKDKCKTVW